MKLGVISDTHGLLREEVVKYLERCDYIIHAGDVGSIDIVDKLNKIAKTFIVRGNIDKTGELKNLPEYKEIEMDEALIYLTHKKEDIPEELREINMVIYGHSHKYSEERKEGVIYLNPGSCGKRRFSLPLTMAIVSINLGKIEIEKIDINKEVDS